jgi:Major Facilitator Superfamily
MPGADEDEAQSLSLAEPPGSDDRHPTSTLREEPVPPLSKPRLYLMCSADFGMAFTWVIKMLVTTPYLRQTLGSGTVVSHIIWSLGPLSGLVTAPLIGALSDRCYSPFGRRRPYIAGGLVASVIGMNVFAAARHISLRPVAIVVAVLGFGVLDVGTNAMMFPARALLGDLVSSEQQHDVQSAAAVIACTAEISAGVYVFILREPVSQIGHLFAVSSVIMVVTAAISLYMCRERPLGDLLRTAEVEMQDFPGDKDSSHVDADVDNDSDVRVQVQVPVRSVSALSEAWHGLRLSFRHFPRPLVKIGFVCWLAWACWYACLPVYSVWIGESVLGGSPTATPGSEEALRFQRGVTIYAVANVVKAALAIVFSIFYPAALRIVGKVGERTVFGLPFVSFGAIIWAFAYTKSSTVAAFVVTAGAIPFICTQAIPIAMAVQRFPEHMASNLGILNLFCVGAQLLDTLYTGSVAKHLGEAVVMRIAAVWALCAGVAAFTLF